MKTNKPAAPDKPAADASNPGYAASEPERKALRKFCDRKASQTAPRLKLQKQGKRASIAPQHQDQVIGQVLLMEALGTTDADFYNGLLGQLINAGSPGKQFDEAGVNFMLAVVKDIKPRDQLEAMLAAQMAAVHLASMTFSRRLAHVDNIMQQDSAERAFNKLARTFTTQMEALKRYRSGGEQKVTVQHVTVSEGGQAIVGNVTQTAGKRTPERQATPTPALSDARQPAMAMLSEPQRVPVEARRRKKDDGRSSS
jgi:hypothetical protein